MDSRGGGGLGRRWLMIGRHRGCNPSEWYFNNGAASPPESRSPPLLSRREKSKAAFAGKRCDTDIMGITQHRSSPPHTHQPSMVHNTHRWWVCEAGKHIAACYWLSRMCRDGWFGWAHPAGGRELELIFESWPASYLNCISVHVFMSLWRSAFKLFWILFFSNSVEG